MLQRVGLALAKLIKPISSSAVSPSQAQVDADQSHLAQSQDFQRFTAPKENLPPQDRPAPLAPITPSTGLGLTVAIQFLMNKIQATGRKLRGKASLQAYEKSSRGRKGSVKTRKGMVLDKEAG